MSDHSDRLRSWSEVVMSMEGAGREPAKTVMLEAADELERLRAALREIVGTFEKSELSLGSVVAGTHAIAKQALGDE